MAATAPLPDARPATATANLLSLARRARTLDELVDGYAATIALDGFSSHACIMSAADGPEPLFGAGAGPFALHLPVRSWDGGRRSIVLGGRTTRPAPARLASLRAGAEIYATFGVALHRRAHDVATGAGLGLTQRQCLARLLMGESEGAIAAALAIEPLTVRAGLDAAVKTLGVRSRAEAVALAARRGLLALLPEDAAFGAGSLH